MKPIYEPKGRALEYSALACNLYRGCVHGCKYCFAPNILRMDRDEFYDSSVLRAGLLEALENQLATCDHAGKRILFSFTSDPYQPGDNYLTRKALVLIKRYESYFEVLTKGGIRASDDFDLYDSGDRFATTLTFNNNIDSRKWEPEAANPAERIAAIRMAHELGIVTWASMEPVISPHQTLSLISECREIVDLFKIGKANYIKNLNVDWRRFANDAVELCEKLGVKYQLKKDLLDLI